MRRTASFRLLNHLVGWDVDSVESLTGTDSESGLQLEYLGTSGGTVNEDDISPWLTPPNLSAGCQPCEWFLVTPSPPRSRLMWKNACEPCFAEPGPGAVGALHDAVALAIADQHVAVSDIGQQAVLLFAERGKRRIGQVPLADPGPIAYATWREWLVVSASHSKLVRIDLSGLVTGEHPATLPGTVRRMRVDPACRVWVAIEEPLLDGRPQVSLWRAERNDSEFTRVPFDELVAAFSPNGIDYVTERGFCLKDAVPCGPCFSWYGRPLDPAPTPPAPPVQYAEQGQLLTKAIDSGVPRCRWHRVRLDATTPDGTTISLSVSTSESAHPPAQGVALDAWSGFAPGVVHPADWQTVDESRDFLIRQPPGRFLFVRVRMTGTGLLTPRIHRVRLDFPRQTSLDQLPQVYRDTPEAEDFSERFLSLFDAFSSDVDELIERLPALLDTGGVPKEVLPWHGSFLDIVMAPNWDTEQRRNLILAAPKLYRMRGTPDGMRAAVRLAFGVDPVLREHAIERPWGSLGQTTLNGGTRLFAPAASRFRLGRSRLGRAPIKSYGRIDLDPFAALAHRFDVLVPLALDATARAQLVALVEAQKPAHTIARVVDASGRFALGFGTTVGIDTAFRSFKPTVLGAANGVSLGRSSILSSGNSKDVNALTLGTAAVLTAR
ncbi:MAG: phage tail protein [Gammaproteobacteria bacterium]